MKSLEDEVNVLGPDELIYDRCPGCGEHQEWWPGSANGRRCEKRCGYSVALTAQAPSIIMCSHCGEALALRDGAYCCEPCGREVRP